MAKILSLSTRTPRRDFTLGQCAILLRKARAESRLTQVQLAEKCDMTQGRISQIENAFGEVSLGLLAKLVYACGYRLRLSIVCEKTDKAKGSVFLSPHRDSLA